MVSSSLFLLVVGPLITSVDRRTLTERDQLCPHCSGNRLLWAEQLAGSGEQGRVSGLCPLPCGPCGAVARPRSSAPCEAVRPQCHPHGRSGVPAPPGRAGAASQGSTCARAFPGQETVCRALSGFCSPTLNCGHCVAWPPRHAWCPCGQRVGLSGQCVLRSRPRETGPGAW